MDSRSPSIVAGGEPAARRPGEWAKEAIAAAGAGAAKKIAAAAIQAGKAP